MRPCKEHWTMMRLAVEERGMSHLVPADGKEAMARTVRDLEAHQAGEKSDPSDFDPLSSMLWAITARCMGAPEEPNSGIGLSIMMDRGDNADGMPENKDEQGFNHVCALCVVRLTFEHHRDGPGGRCGDPACDSIVQPGDVSWDKSWVDGCADAQLEHARNIGLVKSQ